jgi:hypothetical protein
MSEFLTASLSGAADGSNLLTASYATSGRTSGGIFNWQNAVGTGAANWQVVQFSQNGTSGLPTVIGPNAGTAELFVNGASAGKTDAVPPLDSPPKQFQIGSIGGTNPTLVRAVFVYGHVLSATESDQLRDYLFNRWPLDAGSPSCFDGVKESNEAGVDCGDSCARVCPTCSDGIQNQQELGVDCGGPCARPCTLCDDGVLDGQETLADCGGPECRSCCANGRKDPETGETGVDCGGQCGACPTCTDRIKNGSETAVDCGGQCPACTTCANGVKDGDETAKDCGGSCPACFSEVQMVLTPCKGCHGNSGGFSMATYQNFLATSTSTQVVPPPNGTLPACSGQLRVKPGDPDGSLLYAKLNGSATCGIYTKMPPSGAAPMGARDMVKSWILGGALNSPLP